MFWRLEKCFESYCNLLVAFKVDVPLILSLGSRVGWGGQVRALDASWGANRSALHVPKEREGETRRYRSMQIHLALVNKEVCPKKVLAFESPKFMDSTNCSQTKNQTIIAWNPLLRHKRNLLAHRRRQIEGKTSILIKWRVHGESKLVEKTKILYYPSHNQPSDCCVSIGIVSLKSIVLAQHLSSH